MISVVVSTKNVSRSMRRDTLSVEFSNIRRLILADLLSLREKMRMSPDIILSESLRFAEKYPLHITLGLFERISVTERTASEFRSLITEVCKLKELGQIEMFLKVLQELRSGRVSKVRAERPVPDESRAPKGSMAEADSPTKKFSERDRP